MKKAVSAVLAAAMAVSSLSFTVNTAVSFAEVELVEIDLSEPEFTVTNANDDLGTAFLGSVTGAGETLTVPSEIDGYKIVGIGSKAFFGLTGTKSIKLPAAVRTIGANAFAGCLALESITIPDGTAELGAGCFTSCTSLKKVTFGKNLTAIPKNCFYACTALEDVTFPDNISEIGDQAFFGCTGLSGIFVPPTVTEIGENAIGRHYNIRLGSIETINGFMMQFYKDSAAAGYADSVNIAKLPFAGDADMDDKISAADASLVLKEYARISGGNELSFSREQLLAADMNGDGRLDARDASLILKKYADLS